MDERIKQLHLNAGTLAGEEKTCGRKVDYHSEEKAEKAAKAMNGKPTTRHELEAYPCAFCAGWHIGRKMSIAELEAATKTNG